MIVNRLNFILVILMLVGVLSAGATPQGVDASPIAALQATNRPVAPLAAWVRTGGPIGGLGYDVRYGVKNDGSLDTQTMYVTDNYSGVNKSLDGGQNWFTTNDGINKKSGTSGDAVPVFSLTVDPNNGSNVWIGLKDNIGVYKSTDAGQNWVEVTPSYAEKNFVFRGFSIQPGKSNIVYAAGEIPTGVTGKEFDLVRGRVFRTADGGTSWKTVWEGENLARYVIIHPNDPNTLYISTGIFDREANNSNCLATPPANRGGVGVIKATSPDGGNTWNTTLINNGLTDLYVGSLVMHPHDPNILLAGAGNNSCSTNADGSFTGGVFITVDGGQTWTKTLSNDVITSVEFSSSDPHFAYAGGRRYFYFSEDGGFNWQMVGWQHFPWGPPGIIAGFPIDILVDPDNPFTLFANNYGGGNVKSTDGGKNWTLASQGYTGALMFDVAINPTNPAIVYATARSGIFRSTNGGKTWQGLAYPPAVLAETYSVALQPGNPQLVLAAGELGGDVFRSTDGGNSWTRVFTLPGMISGNPYTYKGFKQIFFAPSSTDLVYAGTRKGINQLKPTSVCLGVYKSLDGGVNWQEANDPNISSQCINDLAVHPQFSGLVYAATYQGGLFQTLDGGAIWKKLALPVTDVRSVAIRPDQPGIIYAGTQGQGVYESTDGGASWSQLVAGMEPNDEIWSIVFDPVRPGVAWAGSNRKGVYRWDPSQNKWSLNNDSLSMRAITRLAISSDGNVLYANTWGGGVFRLGDVQTQSVLIYLPIVSR